VDFRIVASWQHLGGGNGGCQFLRQTGKSRGYRTDSHGKSLAEYAVMSTRFV